MKKTFLALASLMAIALLSCSSVDNPISSAEDVNYQQANALNKAALPESYAAAISSSSKIISGRSIGVAGIPVGVSTCSNEINYLFTAPPTTATITKIAYSLGTTSTNVGAFTINSVKIRCNNGYSTTISWNGTSPNPVETPNISAYNLEARTECFASFCGTCNGGYTVAGQYVAQCNKSYTNSYMVNYYQY